MQRAAGVLLSVTSLPSRYGIGCFSQSAYDFVDWLAQSGQRYWQILPLGPTGFGGSDDSPYQSYSAFAGNPYFISLEALIEEGVLTRAECDEALGDVAQGRVDYQALHDRRWPLLRRAYERSDISHNPDYQRFRQDNDWWLADYALFMAVKGFFHDVAWTQWPEDIRKHWGFALDYYRRELYFDVEFQMYLQFQFHAQWSRLKSYANARHIEIIGDIPIYVSMDSADVWAHPELFQLNEENETTAVAGCPPDGFSPTGQLWGNPLYRWDDHRSTGYEWWVSRLWQSFQLYDVVRIDHFRGLDEYFSIPREAENALGGHWEPGPGMDLFRTIEAKLGRRQIIAEDLGYMTDSVRQLVRDSGFPNMKVLEFAFDGEDLSGSNDYLPHNYPSNCVAYTGTHDNETLVGWLQGMTPAMLRQVRDYLCDQATPTQQLPDALIALVMRSRANTCIVPMQDYLGLDNSCRMNQPSTMGGNWRWRLLPGQVDAELGERVLSTTQRYGRANWPGLDAWRDEQEKKAKKNKTETPTASTETDPKA
jgi:4-alpha-glucanotransferase